MEENKQYEYEIISQTPVSDEIWDELNFNNELVEAGFTKDEFRVLTAKTKIGNVDVYAHLSIIDVPDQLNYIVHHAIISKLEHGKEETKDGE